MSDVIFSSDPFLTEENNVFLQGEDLKTETLIVKYWQYFSLVKFSHLSIYIL